MDKWLLTIGVQFKKMGTIPWQPFQDFRLGRYSIQPFLFKPSGPKL